MSNLYSGKCHFTGEFIRDQPEVLLFFSRLLLLPYYECVELICSDFFLKSLSALKARTTGGGYGLPIRNYAQICNNLV
jgi:hypothetical protein